MRLDSLARAALLAASLLVSAAWPGCADEPRRTTGAAVEDAARRDAPHAEIDALGEDVGAVPVS
jgi:hypothetical protein